ncbi:unnamed protein product [Mytilus coruscus]|uniref:DZIP3-like HEPN domain-containing protein n=1 Tax=Mytilus coruscus TaxID=42192 RepID=A0A6J8CP59_MYTCO|nr:unnamed protein product [Mytilus coruscus]
MLRELLAHFIPPDTLFDTVKRNRLLIYNMKSVDWSKIYETKDKGYMDFNIPLIYIIMRSCIPQIQPAKGWGSPKNPEAHEISLGDDIERCRRYLNSIMDRGNTTVSYQELNAFFSGFKDVARRFEIFLGKEPNEFVSQFDVLKTCSMDEDI